MPARVDGPRNQRFESDVPKDLHGMIKMDLHMAQCVDPKGYRRMVIIGKAGKKLFTFPDGFWEEMGELPQWLEDQVRPILFGKESEKTTKRGKKDKKQKTNQLGDDDVNVMTP